MDYKVSFDDTDTIVYVIPDGEDVPSETVEIGEFSYDPEVDVHRTIYHYVRDILNVTSKEDPTEFATFPRNITDMARLSIVVLEETVLPTEIEVEATMEIEVGASQTIDWSVKPGNTTDPSVTFTSSAEGVALVSPEGEVTGVTDGTATITITSVADSDVTAEVVVTVTVAEE